MKLGIRKKNIYIFLKLGMLWLGHFKCLSLAEMEKKKSLSVQDVFKISVNQHVFFSRI